MKYRRSHYFSGTSPAYPKKGTLHQINFYLILTLGSTNRLGSVMLYYGIKLKDIVIIIKITLY